MRKWDARWKCYSITRTLSLDPPETPETRNEWTIDISVIGGGEDSKFVPRISELLKDALGAM